MLGVDPPRIVRWRPRRQALSGRLAEAEQSVETTDEKLEMLSVDALPDAKRSG